MNKLLRKSVIAVATLVFVSSTFFAGFAQASEKPSIRSIGDRTAKSLVLRLRDKDNKNDRMTVKVRIRNAVTGAITFQTFKVRFNDNGNKNVMISGLKANTKYSFEVRDKKVNNGDFTGYSDSKSATTLMK